MANNIIVDGEFEEVLVGEGVHAIVVPGGACIVLGSAVSSCSEVEGGVAGLVCGLLVGVDVSGASKGGHAAGVGAGSDVPDVGLVHALGVLEGGASSGGGGSEEGGGEGLHENVMFFN